MVEHAKKRISENMSDPKQVVDSEGSSSDETEQLNRECFFHIGNTRYLKGTFWDGEWNIHIRQYEWSATGMLYPTKVGIVLSLVRWAEILCHLKTIEETMSEIREGKTVKMFTHLGGNIYMSVGSPYHVVDIRQWWIPDGKEDLKPTRKGIALKFKEWQSLMKCVDELAKEIPEIEQTKPCSFGTDHSNQLSALQCKNCYPNEPIF